MSRPFSRAGRHTRIGDSPALIMLSNIMAGAMGLLSVPLITHGVGASGRGVTASAAVAFGVVPIILACGTPLALRRRVLQEDRDTEVRTFRRISAYTLAPALVVAYALSSTLFHGQTESVRRLVFLGVLAAPLSVSWMGDANVLAAQGRYRAVFGLRLAPPLTALVTLAGGALTHMLTVEFVLLSQMLGSLITFTLGLSLVRVKWFGPSSPQRGFLREGMSYGGAAIAEAASYRLDQVLLLPLAGGFQAGLYSVAVSIASVPDAVGQALGAPYYRQMISETSLDRRRDVARDGVRSAVALGLFVAAGLALAAIPLLPMAFGEAFVAGRTALAIILLGSVVLVVSRVLILCLAAQGRGATITWAQIAGVVVGIGLLFPFARWGANGAAMAATLGYLVTMSIAMRAARVPLRASGPSIGGLLNAVRILLSR